MNHPDTETITELREQLRLATSWRLRAQTEVVELTKALKVAQEEVKELVEALEGLLKEAERIYAEKYYATPDRHKYNIHFNAARAAIAKVKP